MLATSQQNAVRDLFRRVAREVWIVTVAHAGRRGGSTVTWLSAASIDASLPTVLVGLAPNHFTAELVEGSGLFAAHLLREDQRELAWHFAASSGRAQDKLEPLEKSGQLEPTSSAPEESPGGGAPGAPLLRDCLARVICRVYDRKATGDRTYFWADVIGVRELGEGRPLTDQALFAGLDDARRRRLIEQLQADVAWQQPRQAEWRAGRIVERSEPKLGPE